MEATALAASTLQVNELLLKCNALDMELTQARSTIWRLRDQARDDARSAEFDATGVHYQHEYELIIAGSAGYDRGREEAAEYVE